MSSLKLSDHVSIYVKLKSSINIFVHRFHYYLLEWVNRYNKIMNQIGFELKIFKVKIICPIG